MDIKYRLKKMVETNLFFKNTSIMSANFSPLRSASLSLFHPLVHILLEGF